jgi:hypothetical protein
MPDSERALQDVRALRESGLFNPDLTLRQIVKASQLIPGIGDGSPVAWELISRDFVYRGLPDIADGRPVPDEDIAGLEATTVMNFDLTLSEILKMAEQVPALPSGSPVAWELVSRNFVLRGLPGVDGPSAEGQLPG